MIAPTPVRHRDGLDSCDTDPWPDDVDADHTPPSTRPIPPDWTDPWQDEPC